MNIPEQAIDAATAAIMVTEGRTENVRTLASRIVAAAAPFIAAQSFRDAADDIDAFEIFIVNAADMRARADTLEAL